MSHLRHLKPQRKLFNCFLWIIWRFFGSSLVYIYYQLIRVLHEKDVQPFLGQEATVGSKCRGLFWSMLGRCFPKTNTASLPTINFQVLCLVRGQCHKFNFSPGKTLHVDWDGLGILTNDILEKLSNFSIHYVVLEQSETWFIFGDERISNNTIHTRHIWSGQMPDSMFITMGLRHLVPSSFSVLLIMFYSKSALLTTLLPRTHRIKGWWHTSDSIVLQFCLRLQATWVACWSCLLNCCTINHAASYFWDLLRGPSQPGRASLEDMP